MQLGTYLAVQQLMAIYFPGMIATSQSPPVNSLNGKKPSADSIDILQLEKSAAWSTILEDKDNGYRLHKNTIATLFKNWANDSSVKDIDFYQNIDLHMICFNRKNTIVKKNEHQSYSLQHTKESFNSTYGSGVSDLFHDLIKRDFFDNLNKSVDTIVKSLDFLYEVTEYAAENGLLITNRHLPFSEMATYLFEELNHITKKHPKPSGVPDGPDPVKALSDALVKISQLCKTKCDEIKDSQSEKFDDEFIKSAFLVNDLPECLKDLDSASKGVLELVESAINNSKELLDDKEYMGHVYMMKHYLLTLRSMVDAIASIKNYRDAKFRFVGSYSHTLSKKISEVAINIFMFAIGKNDRYYDDIEDRYTDKETLKNWYGFMWHLKEIRDHVMPRPGSMYGNINATKIANVGAEVLESWLVRIGNPNQNDHLMKEIEAIRLAVKTDEADNLPKASPASPLTHPGTDAEKLPRIIPSAPPQEDQPLHPTIPINTGLETPLPLPPKEENEEDTESSMDSMLIDPYVVMFAIVLLILIAVLVFM